MKAGMVTQIRVNTVDCLAILDLMEVLNINPYERSFAQCLALATTSLLGLARRNGIIGEQDAYQYYNRMGPFLTSKNNKTKSHAADLLYAQQSNEDYSPPELPKTKAPETGITVSEAIKKTLDTTENRRAAPKRKVHLSDKDKIMYLDELGLLEAIVLKHEYDGGREPTLEERHRIMELNEILGD